MCVFANNGYVYSGLVVAGGSGNLQARHKHGFQLCVFVCVCVCVCACVCVCVKRSLRRASVPPCTFRWPAKTTRLQNAKSVCCLAPSVGQPKQFAYKMPSQCTALHLPLASQNNPLTVNQPLTNPLTVNQPKQAVKIQHDPTSASHYVKNP